LKNHLRDLIKEIQKDNAERGVVFDEKIYLLEEEDDDVDEDQTA
jgi:hypothetical protein